MIQHDSKYSWFRLSVTLAIATIGNVGMWLIIVVMPAIQSEFHIDRADAALPYTLTMIGFAFGNFIIGGFVDRYGIVRVLIAAAVLNAIGLAGAASAPSIAVIKRLSIFDWARQCCDIRTIDCRCVTLVFKTARHRGGAGRKWQLFFRGALAMGA